MTRTQRSAWPHRTGYILAWRAFEVSGKKDKLLSLNARHRWPVKTPFRAKSDGCGPWHTEEAAPGHNCSCGIYALKNRREAQDYVEECNRMEADEIILGQVALWGRVIVHEYGYRAEFAYPQALYVPTHRRNGRDRIAKHYRTLAQTYGIEVYPLSIFDQKRTTPKGVRKP